MRPLAAGVFTLAASFGLALVGGSTGCSLGDVARDDCTSDAECSTAFGAGSVCEAGYCVEAPGCIDNRQCREEAVGTTCQAGACVPAPLPAACQVLAPDDITALPPGAWGDRVMLGVLFKTDAAKEEARVAAIKLAIDEINDLAGGVAGRSLGAIVCNDDTDGDPSNDVDEALSRFRYLAGDLALPVVLGPSRTPEAQAVVAAAVENDWDTIVFSPSATGITLSQFPDVLADGGPGLFWRTCPSDSFQGLRMAQLFGQEMVTDVAIIFQQDAYGTGLRDAVVANVGPGVTTQTYPFPLDGDVSMAIGVALSQAESNGHNALLFVSNDAARTRVAMDLAAAAASSFVSLPWFLTDGSKDSVVLLEGATGEIATILGNTLGTAPNNPTTGVFRDQLVAEGFDPANFSFVAHAYDATYATGFAIGAAGDTILTGRVLAAGLDKLAAGDAITIGPTDFNQGVERLRDGGTIDIDGTSGPLDFGEGEAPGEIEVWAPNATLDGFDQVGAPVIPGQ